MRADVSRDYEFGRQYLPHIKQILGLHLIDEAPSEEDMKHATDLIVVRFESVRIAVRVRRPDYRLKYGDEFTMRLWRPMTNVASELVKILDGWADYFMYGFGNRTPPALDSWVLGDLNVFRSWYRDCQAARRPIPGERRLNEDDSSWFWAFRVDDLPDDFVIAQERVEEAA